MAVEPAISCGHCEFCLRGPFVVAEKHEGIKIIVTVDGLPPIGGIDRLALRRGAEFIEALSKGENRSPSTVYRLKKEQL